MHKSDFQEASDNQQRVITEGTYMFNSKRYEKTDESTMGGPFSITFSNI